MSRSLGIPVKLLHEAVGRVVTMELKSGELYRGSMIECEDNWNCQLENITFTAKDGKVSQLEHVFIRGSKVRFMVIPDMLKNAPIFKRLESRINAQAAGRGAPPGRGAVPSIRRMQCYLNYFADLVLGIVQAMVLIGCLGPSELTVVRAYNPYLYTIEGTPDLEGHCCFDCNIFSARLNVILLIGKLSQALFGSKI
ncbi:hypothetical protein TEA_007206 [Camellia sinensis var. sinensis]|uniref:Small nuclear ribonucleoprotein Sm D3 n=2 Tax=Camellia sinensis TaxID=4442 RepID=A0A4S4ERN3_CAMSN|nr:hypothetical protein TEA_007206 [Camellia sinensis var. sinensis]